MSRFYFIIVFLFLGLITYAQDSHNTFSVQLQRAQNNFVTSRMRAQALRQQLNSIDSLYKTGDSLYRKSLKDYRQSKNAFKSLKSEYKNQMQPLLKQANSKNKEKNLQARERMKVLKVKYQGKGNRAANEANMASAEMVRAKKMMQRSKMKRRLILPRLNKSEEQVHKWGLVLYEIGIVNVSVPDKSVL